MRRYLQGTLDFSCAVYAAVNAIGCVRDLRLPEARDIFNTTLDAFAARPSLWAAFIRNNTDHYWVVRYMLRRWSLTAPRPQAVSRPGGFALPVSDADAEPDICSAYLPERLPPRGPESPPDRFSDAARREAEAVRAALREALQGGATPGRAVLARFHRFLPGVASPLVSHWTCIRSADNAGLYLKDSSAEKDAVHCIGYSDLLPDAGLPNLRIVPESLYLLTAASANSAPRSPGAQPATSARLMKSPSFTPPAGAEP
ncbi:MAG: hypothetical protein LBR82_06280 [Desulfovibrio sp.]|jgi:hypothetical protein|nr:hypothetical protein [Desulfovibrio sp.]